MKLLLSILLVLSIGIGSAQEKGYCGTSVKTISPEFISMLQMPPTDCTSPLQARKEFQISAFISKDTLQPPITTLAQINACLEEVNDAFSKCSMSFKVCYEENLEDFHFYDWDQAEDEQYALNYHYNPSTINIYFVGTVETIEEGVVGGYAFFPGGPDMVVIGCDNDGTVPANVVIHELGHFFGLYHTFETDFGVENIDQSNCETAGDFICDTEADPNGDIDDNCNYLSPLSDGTAYYTPPIDNYMSYYSGCECRFTLQQYNRMVEMYETMRSYLW